jgi:hypothetical protein
MKEDESAKEIKRERFAKQKGKQGELWKHSKGKWRHSHLRRKEKFHGKSDTS